MELTEAQKAELASIVEAARYGRPWIDDMRGGDRAAYRARRERLVDLLTAWRTVDLDTQIALSAALVRMGDKRALDPSAPTPDFGEVIDEHLASIGLPSGKREHVDGFRDAILFLWDIWCAELPLNRTPPVGDEVLDFMTPIVAETFDLSVPQARQKTYDRLRALEKTEAGLPRRK